MQLSSHFTKFGNVVLLSLMLASQEVQSQESAWDIDTLQQIDPAELGYLTHSTLLVDSSGTILWSWGDLDEKLEVFSMRKSLLSVLIGILIADGKLDINSTLSELHIDDKQGLSDQEKTASVLDLLITRSGVYHPAAYETPRMINNRPNRDQHLPGEYWFYNNWDFNTLNTVFERAAGRSVADAFKVKIADPIGMRDFETDDVSYVFEDVSAHPAVTFRLSAVDLSKFAVLLLNEGMWHEEQIVPAEWIRESTSVHSDIGMFGGYGYSWWVATHGDHLPRLKMPDGTYSARGTGEQMILILPSLNVAWLHRTRVTSPDQEKMHVTETARLLSKILNTHAKRERFHDSRF